ncbi:MAG: hypothetical protein ACFFG0_12210 [Candidatus Thorarchaeota archaeon]
MKVFLHFGHLLFLIIIPKKKCHTILIKLTIQKWKCYINTITIIYLYNNNNTIIKNLINTPSNIKIMTEENDKTSDLLKLMEKINIENQNRLMKEIMKKTNIKFNNAIDIISNALDRGRGLGKHRKDPTNNMDNTLLMMTLLNPMKKPESNTDEVTAVLKLSESLDAINRRLTMMSDNNNIILSRILERIDEANVKLDKMLA